MPIRGSIANSLKSFGADRRGGIPKIATPVVDYIMVAGGGGGGFSGGGGGGGGGLLTGSGYPVSSGITLTFSVGGGGSGGNPGGGSSITGPGTPTISVIGGGDGGDGPSGANLGGDGGCGGGGARDNSVQPINRGAGTPGPTPGSPNQGNNGGNGASPPQGAAGGGGGVGASGQNGVSNPGQPHDLGRNGGDGRGINDYWGGFGVSYLNPAISPAAGPWTGFIMGCGGGNGIQRDGSQLAGFGGSSSSIPALYPRTGADGGGGPGSAKPANNATQYTGSGGGGGPPNPGGGASPSGGSGSGGSILVRFDEFYSNAVSTTGGPLYSYQNGFHMFHFIGSGSITF